MQLWLCVIDEWFLQVYVIMTELQIDFLRLAKSSTLNSYYDWVAWKCSCVVNYIIHVILFLYLIVDSVFASSEDM